MKRLFSWFRNSMSYLWLAAVAAYLAFSAGQAALRNYGTQQDAKKLDILLTEANQERDRLEALVVYYKTDGYKEKELRRALLLKRPDEKVFTLPESSMSKAVEDEFGKTQAKTPDRTSIPIWQQWGVYLVKGKDV
jgi:cell division protein FtsB